MRDTKCKLFSISGITCARIIDGLVSNNRIRVKYSSDIYGEGRTRNRTKKATRIPRIKCLKIRFCKFVRFGRSGWERVTELQVLNFLLQEGTVAIPTNADGNWEQKPFEVACCNTCRFVQDCGYKRGRRNGSLVQKQSVLVHCHMHLSKFFVVYHNQPP